MDSTTSRLRKIVRYASFAAVLLAISSGAHAEEITVRKVGVGYKVGNGIGFQGGDLLLRLVPHVVFDLQASYASAGDMSGFGIAPTVQAQLKPIGHTPYVSVGLVHLRMSSDTQGGYTTGFVANAGYDWRFASGVGVLVGAGIGDLGPVHVTRGYAAFENRRSGVYFNLEAGLRYYF